MKATRILFKHLTSRGDRREAIYEDDAEKIFFLSLSDGVYDV